MLVILVAVALGLVIASEILKKRIEEDIARALGPAAHYSAITISLGGVDIKDVAIDARPDWPEPHELTAKLVHIVPRFDSLLRRDPIVLSDIVITDGEAVLVREKDGLEILPVLLHKDQPKPDHPDHASLAINHIRVARMVVNFYDRTVGPKNFKIHLEPVAGTLAGYTEPVDQAQLQISLAGPALTPQGAPSGDVSIAGSIFPHHGSDLNAELQSVDLRTVAPYMAKAGEAGIAGGTVSLSVHSVVKERLLNASGVINLHNLQVSEDDSLTGTVLGLPRKAVIDSLKNRHGDVVLHFSVSGNVEDPKFSLNEALSTRLSAGLADALGMPVDSLAKGVSSLGEQGKDAATTIGHALKSVLSPDAKDRAQSR